MPTFYVGLSVEQKRQWPPYRISPTSVLLPESQGPLRAPMDNANDGPGAVQWLKMEPRCIVCAHVNPWWRPRPQAVFSPFRAAESQSQNRRLKLPHDLGNTVGPCKKKPPAMGAYMYDARASLESPYRAAVAIFQAADSSRLAPERAEYPTAARQSPDPTQCQCLSSQSRSRRLPGSNQRQMACYALDSCKPAWIVEARSGVEPD